MQLFLDSPLDVAVTQFQALHRLGRSYAGLLIFIEGLSKLNLINEVVYQHYKARYMQPLKTLPEEEPARTRQNEEQHKILQETRKQLRDVIDQFPALQPKARQYWLKYALERPEIPESTELLRKYNKGCHPPSDQRGGWLPRRRIYLAKRLKHREVGARNSSRPASQMPRTRQPTPIQRRHKKHSLWSGPALLMQRLLPKIQPKPVSQRL